MVLNRPAAAYRYEIPYSDLTVLPLIAEMRNQPLPDTVRPEHVVLYAVPATARVTVTRVSVLIVTRELALVLALVRMNTLHAAARVVSAASETPGVKAAPATNRVEAHRSATTSRGGTGRTN